MGRYLDTDNLTPISLDLFNEETPAGHSGGSRVSQRPAVFLLVSSQILAMD